MDRELRNFITDEIEKVEREKRYYEDKVRQDKLQLDRDTEELVKRMRRLSELYDARKELVRLR